MRLFLNAQRSLIFVFLILLLIVAAYITREFIWKKISPEVIFVEQNLIFNGDAEILDNGRPISWSSGVEGCAIGSPGFQSDHALTLSAGDRNIPRKWDTQIKDVKCHTHYTLTFWYRLPNQGMLEILLFGERLPVTKMFCYNPMHWCRYSAIVDSGNYSGDCGVRFLAQKGNGPFKFWIDQIELYEGESAIGGNCARLEYQYYNKTYVCPDVVSPLPFAFEWTFADEGRPLEIQYVVELPAEVEFVECALGRICKWPPDGWSITWTRPDYTSRVETEKITIDHRPYIRVVAHVPCVNGDRKQFTDYVVPVGVRDYWEGSLGRYSGTISMCLYVRSKVPSGSFPFYYYAKWDKGEQPRRELNLEVTTVSDVGSCQNLCLIGEVQMQAGEKNPQLGEDFLHVGLNGMGYLSLRGGESELKGKIEMLNRLGLKYFSAWVNIPSFRVGDGDAKAMDITGQRTGRGGWCLSYRGPDWVKKMNQYKTKLENGINFFAFDDVFPCACYCDKCKSSFAEFLKMNTDMPYVDPSEFMKEGWNGNGIYRILWKDFSLWHYGKTAQAMKEELIQHAESRGLNSKIFFGISSWLPCTHAFAAKSLSAFDFDIRQTYINWASSSFEGSPKLVGDYLYRSQEALGIYARPLAPTLSPGLSYMHPACALDPYSQMKYQILESMMAPNFAGYVMYAGKDIDLGDMKYMSEANALMKRFEEIILRGKAVEPIEINKWSVVRIKKLESQGLVLVSDYSTYEPEEKNVRLSSRELSGKTLVDAETGEKLKPVAGTYEVKICTERARLFHFSNDSG